MVEGLTKLYKALGGNCYTEGANTVAMNNCSHAEGRETLAVGNSYAKGNMNKIIPTEDKNNNIKWEWLDNDINE